MLLKKMKFSNEYIHNQEAEDNYQFLRTLGYVKPYPYNKAHLHWGNFEIRIELNNKEEDKNREEKAFILDQICGQAFKFGQNNIKNSLKSLLDIK